MNGAVSHSQFGDHFHPVWLQPTTAVIAFPAFHQHQPVRPQPSRADSTHREHQPRCTNSNQRLWPYALSRVGTGGTAHSDSAAHTSTQPDARDSYRSSHCWPIKIRAALAFTAAGARGIHSTTVIRGTRPNRTLLVRSRDRSGCRDRNFTGSVSGPSPVYVSADQITCTRSSISDQRGFRIDFDLGCASGAHASRWIPSKCRSIYSSLGFDCSQAIRPTRVRWKEPM